MIVIKKRIGIPRSLLYYKYFPLWKTFLEELGVEIVLSDRTNSKIIDIGGR
ncbi:MAG: acyl-CoA dehydratase activase-related protein, partial [Candidatus Helarchaeota archaeon]